MKLKVRYQILIAVVLVALISVGWFFFLELPRVRRLGELNKEKERKEEEIKSAEANAARLEAVLKELPQVEDRLEEFNARMPSEPGLSSLIREFQRICDEAGVEFVSIKPEAKPNQQGQYSELPMEITVGGYFSDFVDFLFRAYTLPREIKITAVNIVEGEDKLPHLKATLTVSAFMFGQAPQTQTGTGTTGKSKDKETSGGASDKTSGESGDSSGSKSGTQEAP